LLAVACNNQLAGGGQVDASVPPDLAPLGPFADFPAQPVLDTGGATPVPANAASLFGPAGSGAASGGPCLVEPEIGALIPQNWLRLRFRFVAPAAQNLFEIRVHAANQTNDLVVYTTATQWTMPLDQWTSLTTHTTDQPITVTVRGAQLSGNTLMGMPALGTTGDITIAPVAAGGTIVYWTTSGGTILRGFKIGEETVHDILKPSQATAGTACIGCHSSTPDGLYVAFSQTPMANDGSQTTIGLRSVDGQASEPPFLTVAARALLARVPQELPTFSGAHWQSGDRIALVNSGVGGKYALSWIDLEATAQTQGTGFGVIARTGDSRESASAVFSHNGRNIVYVSGTGVGSGVTVTDGDLYTVPYNNRMGGSATPVAGASETTFNEAYPAFSPDDSMLAFSRVPAGQSSYNNAQSEVFVVPTGGGTATRLSANDAPACSGVKSPGILNSWPKWSPESQQVGGKQYYWITFSSTRAGGPPQLYVTGVVVEGGVVKTYKAVYLWNQPAAQGNHTAAWDVFKIVVG
jgi:mono/diheme cytochrome c family protein